MKVLHIFAKEFGVDDLVLVRVLKHPAMLILHAVSTWQGNELALQRIFVAGHGIRRLKRRHCPPKLTKLTHDDIFQGADNQIELVIFFVLASNAGSSQRGKQEPSDIGAPYLMNEMSPSSSEKPSSSRPA
eukprot:766071-Hanusia_phi.AAC.2